MIDRKRQRELLGYLLGALDDRQRQRIARRLAHNPALAAELTRVEESLQPLCSVSRVRRPPSGLAQRTCRMVFAYGEAMAGRKNDPRALRRPLRGRARAMSPTAAPPTSTPSWGWSDLLVAAVVVLAVTGLILPAIHSSRLNMRLTACQDHLREIGLGRAQFGQSQPVASEPTTIAGARLIAPAPDPRRWDEVGAAECAPVWLPAGTPISSADSPVFRLALGPPNTSAHQGFSQQVNGRNVLFVDGHADYLATGRIADSTPSGAASAELFAGSRAWGNANSPASASELPPIVFVSHVRP